jgi:Flp pilus assembly protein TadG
MASLIRILRGAEGGAELVEFALTFPLLLLVVLGIVDFGFLFQQFEVITNAAREGGRVAVLPPYSQTAALMRSNATARVDQYIAASFLSGGGVVTTTVTGPTAVAIGGNCMSTVTVNVTYPHQFIFLSGIASHFGAAFGTSTLRASSTMRSEVASGACP